MDNIPNSLRMSLPVCEDDSEYGNEGCKNCSKRVVETWEVVQRKMKMLVHLIEMRRIAKNRRFSLMIKIYGSLVSQCILAVIEAWDTNREAISRRDCCVHQI